MEFFYDLSESPKVYGQNLMLIGPKLWYFPLTLIWINPSRHSIMSKELMAVWFGGTDFRVVTVEYRYDDHGDYMRPPSLFAQLLTSVHAVCVSRFTFLCFARSNGNSRLFSIVSNPVCATDVSIRPDSSKYCLRDLYHTSTHYVFASVAAPWSNAHVRL